MPIKEVKPEEDVFGRAVVELMKKFGIHTFIFSGIDQNGQGVSSMDFKDTSSGIVALSLLMRAVPQLFLMLEEAKLTAFVGQLDAMLKLGDSKPKETKGEDLLSQFTVEGKLKN
jgi:hypothetical protein